jgi:hypothetical protein
MNNKLRYVFVLVVTFLALAFLVDFGWKVTNWRKERAVIASIIENDPKFAKLRIEIASLGYCRVLGEVDSEDDYSLLISELEAKFGADGARSRSHTVQVHGK